MRFFTLLLGLSALTLAQSEPDNTVTIYNSDCPCNREKFKFCTYMRRRNHVDGKCYKTSQRARSMTVDDPWIGSTNRISCTVYHSTDCTSDSVDYFHFQDTLHCVELKTPKDNDEFKKYGSFRCVHNTVSPEELQGDGEDGDGA